ncbi:MAG: LD-carboxypeptidase [Flammeovirgaceae bacterium]
MNLFKTPDFLKKGDKVIIVATSGKLKSNQLEDAIKIISSWGLEVDLGENVYQTWGTFAGEDNQRRSDLQKALDSTVYKAIFCARGGYGASRIIDDLDFTYFKSHPKWLVGFSDITAIHLTIQSIGFQSIHACMPSQFANEEYKLSVQQLKNVLFGTELPMLYTIPNKMNRLGVAIAPLMGGNLSLLADQIGTNSDISTEGKILFIEEIDEYLYRIDRLMTQLKRAGKFENLAGLVVGHFTNLKPNPENEFGLNFREIILEKVSKYSYPVAFDFQIGHQPNNFPLICGGVGVLEVKSNKVSLGQIVEKNNINISI